MRIIAMLPTYNEAENIGPLIDAILAQGPELEALVVDDDSPDGTWRLVAEREKTDPRVHLLHRTTRRGRGLAGIAGFCEALRLGADAVIEMDADWSHDPRWIPSLIARSRHADVVIGSRLVPGGSEEGRPFVRRLITRAANAYIRFMLRLPVRDATSGYRLFSRRCLEAIPWDAMRATGPEVVQEVLLAAHARGFTMAETPIIFVERRHGQSTFNRRIMIRSLKEMVRLRRHPGRLVPVQPLEMGADEARGFTARQQLTSIPPLLTIPLAWLYGLGRAVHRTWNVYGPIKRQHLPVPVVCIGNLTVGGTGKTPFVRLMAETMRRKGFRPGIVSRGYRAEEPLKRPLIVSNGERVLTQADQAGDEPQWLAEQCVGIPVVVHSNRHWAGLTAIRMLGANLVVLDDGFQHDRLRRKLDVVLWDVCDEPRRMRLIPAGRLREGLGALHRASAIVLTHAEYLPETTRAERIDRVIRQIKRHAPAVPIFESETRIVGSLKVSGRLRAGIEEAPEGAWPWNGRKVLAISGLARPQGFESMIRASGAQVVRHYAYPDHYAYHEELAEQWREAMNRTEAEMILTTTKDAVKLAILPLFGLPILAVEIAMGIKDEARWEAFLDHCVEKWKKQYWKPKPAQGE